MERGCAPLPYSRFTLKTRSIFLKVIGARIAAPRFPKASGTLPATC